MSRRFAPLVVLLLVVAACGGDDDDESVQSATTTTSAGATPTSAASGTAGVTAPWCEAKFAVDTPKASDLHVSLAEWTIAYDELNATAGVVQVAATNNGNEGHELVIARGTKDDLVVTDGVVDESAADVVGEIEPFDSRKECIANFILSKGTYTLFCGIAEADEGASHYQQGMVAQLEVK